jgi:CheY-like chemotaxis protein
MRKRKVIICEVKMSLKVLKNYFETRGYNVVPFESPMDCPIDDNDDVSCEKVRACSDIIITDFMMPIMNGAEMFKAQTRRGCRVQIKNKALMAGYVEDDRLKVMQETGYKIFAKPLKFDLLSAWLDELEPKMDISRALGVTRKEHRSQGNKDVTVTILSDAMMLKGIATNMSASGLCVKIDVPVREEQKISVSIGRSDNHRPALVRWMSKNAEGRYLVGVSVLSSHYWYPSPNGERDMVSKDIQYIIKPPEHNGPKQKTA